MRKKSDLEHESEIVKFELQIVIDRYQQEQTDLNKKTVHWIEELSAKVRRRTSDFISS